MATFESDDDERAWVAFAAAAITRLPMTVGSAGPTAAMDHTAMQARIGVAIWADSMLEKVRERRKKPAPAEGPFR